MEVPRKQVSSVDTSPILTSNPFQILESAEGDEQIEESDEHNSRAQNLDTEVLPRPNDPAQSTLADMEIEKEIRRKREREGAVVAEALNAQKSPLKSPAEKEAASSGGVQDPAQHRAGSQRKPTRKVTRANLNSQKEGRNLTGEKWPLVHTPKRGGRRLEQARLDRVYFPRNQFTEGLHIKMRHDDGVRLSDHHPVCLTLEKAEGRMRRRGTTYFKTCPDMIKKAEVKAEIKKRWEQAGNNHQDARVRWELKWAETRRFLKEKAREEKASRSVIQKKLVELQQKRRDVAKNRTRVADGELTKLEKDIRELEDSQAKLWRRWSQMKWMKEGDAPSRFFFAILKTKRLKEDITALETEA
ncbi:hypothetical protein R1sor_008006 [Riccia sorocarpa]|uniref:Uncharacterized protein n=1 Tax=Riccia sorocarpa TaxID=122646 RepID=A0ABD3HW70_9MARC